MLIFLLTTITYNGFSAFYETRIKLDIYFNEELIDPLGNRENETINVFAKVPSVSDEIVAEFSEILSLKFHLESLLNYYLIR